MSDRFANELLQCFWNTRRRQKTGQCRKQMPGSKSKPRIGPFTIHFFSFPSFEEVGVDVKGTIASPDYEGKYQLTDVNEFCREVVKLTRSGITMDAIKKVLAGSGAKVPEYYYNGQAAIFISDKGCFTIHLELDKEES